VVNVAGRYELLFQARSPAAAPTSREGTADLARAMVRDVLGAQGPHVEVIAGPAVGQRFELPPPGRDLILGRGETCDAIVVDPDLSREHLRLRRAWAGVSAADLGSKNGSAVNGARLTAGAERALVHGDRIALGSTTVLAYTDPADDYMSTILPPGAVTAPARAPRRPRKAVYAAAGVVVVAALAALVLLLLHT
jgi:pSer/pThr/pTyr-binding forkhead associated (FHA) protein